jgi:hypothetical protein
VSKITTPSRRNPTSPLGAVILDTAPLCGDVYYKPMLVLLTFVTASTQPQVNLRVTKYLVGPPTTPPPPPLHTSRQCRKLIFGMQPYFHPTRKMTSKKMEDDIKKRKREKNENDLKQKLKKMKMTPTTTKKQPKKN